MTFRSVQNVLWFQATYCFYNFANLNMKTDIWQKGMFIKDVQFFCDFWRYLPTKVCPMYYILTIYLCTMSDFLWRTYLSKNWTSFMDVPEGKIEIAAFSTESDCGAEYLVFGSSRSLKILSFVKCSVNDGLSRIPPETSRNPLR